MHPESPAPGLVLDVPGLTAFRLPDGRTFELDLIAAIRRLNHLRTEHSNNGWDYLDAVKRWVQEQTGVELTDGQADWLSDRVVLEQQAIKKKRSDELSSLQRTPE